MDLEDSIKEACDDIEERIYEINGILREKGLNEELTLELNTMINTVKDIKENITTTNQYNARNELLNIQHELDELFENAVMTR